MEKKRMTIKDATKITGLTEYTLRRGIAEGRYPHIRTGGPGKGRILIDLDLLEERLKQDALDSTRNIDTASAINYGRLRRVAE